MNFGENWRFSLHFGRGRSEQVQQKGKNRGNKKKKEDFVEVFVRRMRPTIHGFSRRLREEKRKKEKSSF